MFGSYSVKFLRIKWTGGLWTGSNGIGSQARDVVVSKCYFSNPNLGLNMGFAIYCLNHMIRSIDSSFHVVIKGLKLMMDGRIKVELLERWLEFTAQNLACYWLKL